MSETKQLRAGDMTEGSITKGLLAFMIPIMIGNIFTQMYNMVDAVIVGQTMGADALAAINAGSSLTMVCSAFMVAVGIGASVIAAQYFGAHDQAGIRKAISTTLVVAVAVGLFVSIVPAIFLKPLLHLMQTPKDVFDDCYDYMLIYMLGNICVFFYHMGTAVLRGLGDSKYPLYMLILCSVLNVVLDLLFILVFHLGVAGAAYATILSQLVSAVLIVIRMCGKRYGAELTVKTLRADKAMAIAILTIGIPAGLQQLAMSVGNVVVQSFVNSFGKETIAAFGSVIKIDGFIILPLMAIGNAITTYVGQNIGAKKMDRLTHGVRISVLMTVIIGLGLGVLLFIFAPWVTMIFTTEEAVVRMGGEGLRLLAFFYVFWGLNQLYGGILRGAGATMIAFLANVIATAVRVVVAYFLGYRTGSYQGIWISFAVTNILGAALTFLYYKFGNWRAKADQIHKEPKTA